jgi:hypothetical protein
LLLRLLFLLFSFCLFYFRHCCWERASQYLMSHIAIKYASEIERFCHLGGYEHDNEMTGKNMASRHTQH